MFIHKSISALSMDKIIVVVNMFNFPTVNESGLVDKPPLPRAQIRY